MTGVAVKSHFEGIYTQRGEGLSLSYFAISPSVSAGTAGRVTEQFSWLIFFFFNVDHFLKVFIEVVVILLPFLAARHMRS